MNAVIDEDLHRSLKPVLEQLGFTVFDIRDHGLRGQPDSAIYAYSQQKNAVLFTADLDFSNIINYPLSKHSGIAVLRFPNDLSTQLINHQIITLLARIKSNEYTGNIVIITPSQIRIRRAL